MSKKLTMSARNEAFWAKPKAQQRVAVAKDVIKQINKMFYKPVTGDYATIRGLKKPINDAPEKLDKSLQVIKNMGGRCEVCGIGGCFVSLVNLGNNAITETYIGDQRLVNYDGFEETLMRKLLRRVFTPRQLTLIECAFEKTPGMKDYGKGKEATDRERYDAADFGRKYRNNSDRLIAIMENIIKNKGTFKP